jgi:hypothetical protein
MACQFKKLKNRPHFRRNGLYLDAFKVLGNPKEIADLTYKWVRGKLKAPRDKKLPEALLSAPSGNSLSYGSSAKRPAIADMVLISLPCAEGVPKQKPHSSPKEK